MLLATSIMTLVVLLPALGLTTILMSAFIGVLLMILTGCIAPDEAYAELDGQVLVLLAALLPLGIALQQTGVAAVIARGLAGLAEPLGPYGLLACVYIVTVALTAIVSNAATAVVITPIAVSVAMASGLSPMPFVLAVMFAASNSFVTPMGYHTNLFVYGPGGYEFHDYIRVGGPLTILMIVAATLVIPLFYGF
jgi:di/tricarboxylate transporter